MSGTADEGYDEYPPQVKAAVDQLLRLSGVISAKCDLCSLEDVREADLGSFIYSTYPIASLRRTGGGRPDEGLLRIDIRFSRDEAGWRAVEFLAWFFRDRARGGEVNEFRPFALPPIAGFDVQFGETLRFFAELFDVSPAEGAPLTLMQDLAADLARMIDLYDSGLRAKTGIGLTQP